MNPSRLTALGIVLTCTVGCGTENPAAPKAASPAPTTPIAARSSTTATEAPTTSTVPATTAAPAPHPAVAAKLAFWDRYIEMTGRLGPFDPLAIRAELDEFTTGVETAKLFEFIQGNMLAGRAVRGTADHSPRLDAVDAATATVIDCLVDRTGVYAVGGTRVDTEGLLPQPATVGLRLDAGVRKVETVSFGSEVCQP
ncbi:MAG: hypothetical protein V9E99_05685 [Microthrixaceae bacterium]